MSDLISKKVLLEALKGVEVCWYINGNYTTYDETTIMDIIKQQPTVEAVPVVHAKWIDSCCSNCGAYIPTDSRIDYIDEKDCKFCYECGADMRTSAE